MTNEPTKEEVLKSIVVDSTQFNADDCVNGPITVEIEAVSKGTKEQPINVHLVGHKRVFRPCKTVRRMLIALWSDDPRKWRGQRFTLYTDPEIRFGGVRVGGLRISHATGITSPRTFLITQSRGRRSEVTIQPIVAEEHADGINELLGEIAAADTEETLKAVGFVVKHKPKAVQDAVRPAYAKRLAELKAPVSDLAAFEAEIEAAKASKAALSKLSARCNEFDKAGPKLLERIEAYYATAADELEGK